ncbi:hypothetical protein C8A00DRAFT_35081 [Chaetomidium leptoderma]|uniref:COX assembly mitochondrial protein n=1 Tax=Chaetomidium leptoderma TaxID=669021 RepID=A0AAN6ZVW8_9PEZI|nr:hypothetical protein C8A00DRAFT_35081 [Chaetomidium leptoderma]
MAAEGRDQAGRLPMPSRNPLPLSATQEGQVRDIFHARVRDRCRPEIKGIASMFHPFRRALLSSPFADCAIKHTYTASFLCRETLHVMNSCMKLHATQEEQDGAREDWFAQRLERQKERERKALRKAEQESFLREWWRLPEKDREQARKEMEKLQTGERVGGFAKKKDTGKEGGQGGEGR